jgi:hypothetical protein
MQELPSMSDPRLLGRHHSRSLHMRLAALVLAVSVVATSIGAQAPSPSDPLSAFLTGRWEGTGTILGQPARVELEWAPVLSDRFARLTWVSHIGAAPKTQRFEGHAYYQRTAGAMYRATWFDSSGMVRPITAAFDRPSGGPTPALVASWGTAETEQGETTYRRVSDQELEVVDRVLGKNGEWREFGRSTLRRVP